MILAAGGAAYAGVKLARKDADRIEEYTGVPPEELSDEDLQAVMDELNIQSMEMDDNDRAALKTQAGAEPEAATSLAGAASDTSYLDELERLAALRDQGAISEQEFEAKKSQLLGL